MVNRNSDDTNIPATGVQSRSSSELLPKFFQSSDNKKFLQSTVDQLVQPGVVKKLNGYVGRTFAKSAKAQDSYILAADEMRQHYQLEPGISITDELGNTVFFKDYIDYINQLKTLGANVANHARLNRQEFYAWNPHINFDKIIDFQEYYWVTDTAQTIHLNNVGPSDIIGELSYTLPSGDELSNGMMISFDNNVQYGEYSTGAWFVNGVGSGIVLTPVITSFTQKDYITIGRESADRNPWSVSNCWVHSDVIRTAARINNATLVLDQTKRAERPIIEFESNLKLFNFGIKPKAEVDVIDTVTKFVTRDVLGSYGYTVDGIALTEGMRVIFAAASEADISGKTFKVTFSQAGRYPQLFLVPESDADPVTSEVVSVSQGIEYNNSYFWYNGATWQLAQNKTSINQSPLFDLCDEHGTDFSDYSASTFAGTKLFSYKLGSSIVDPVLGFPLYYRSIQNIGDITFSFDLSTDSFFYKTGTLVATKSTKTGFLKKINADFSLSFENGWITADVKNTQPVVRTFNGNEKTNNFEIDVFNNSSSLNDLSVEVYINGNETKNFVIDTTLTQAQVVLAKNITQDDIVTLECSSAATKNENGFYKIPINLQYNPQNEDLTDISLSQISSHAATISKRVLGFTGAFPGANNLRDYPLSICKYGTQIVQHSSPLALSMYHITSTSNVIRAINFSRDKYAQFKKSFIHFAGIAGVDLPVRQHVDHVLSLIADGVVASDPYTNTDMIPFKSFTVERFNGGQYFPLKTAFESSKLSTQAVLIYKNGKLLQHGIDYYFNDAQTVVLTSIAIETDIIEVIEYSNTGGIPCPATPAKLGIMPKYSPKIFVDHTCSPEFKTYEESGTGLQFTVDDFHNLYAPSAVSVIIELRDAQLDTISRSKKVLNVDYTVSVQGDFLEVSLTGSIPPYSIISVGVPPVMVQGHDGSVIAAFGDYRDELILDLETRIFNNIKVDSSNVGISLLNLVPGFSRETDYSIGEFNQLLAPHFYEWAANNTQTDFTSYAGIDDLNPYSYNYRNFYAATGQGTELPAFWRGMYRFFFDTDRPDSCPWECLGLSEKPEWWDTTYGPAPYTKENSLLWSDIRNGVVRYPTGAINFAALVRPIIDLNPPVDSDGKLLAPASTNYISGIARYTGSWQFGDVAPVEAAWRRSSEFKFSLLNTLILMYPSLMFSTMFDVSRTKRNPAGQLVYSETGTRITLASIISQPTVLTAGIINYVYDYLNSSESTELSSDYISSLSSINSTLSLRVGGFTSKDKFSLILDAKSLTSETKFVPQENYKVVFNVSSPTKIVNYSGVIIEKVSAGYKIKGYNTNTPYFSYYPWTQTGAGINAGGISEPYSSWTPNEQYVAGKVVFYNGKYYRAVVSSSTATFNERNFVQLPGLPVVGGENALLRTSWDSSAVKLLPYSTTLTSTQDVVDFLLGYGKFLEDEGFVFDNVSAETGKVQNWVSSVSDFLFWTTEGWPDGSVLSISPAAEHLTLQSDTAVVKNIYDADSKYSIFRVDGNKFNPDQISIDRAGGLITLSSRSDVHGIFGATFQLVQKEHVVLLDNVTLFNDVLFDRVTGFKQDRLKVIGAVSTKWDGSLNAPGFIFDNANVVQWNKWESYHPGQLVRHQGKYYIPKTKIDGSAEFDAAGWTQVDTVNQSSLVENLDYKTRQFVDFYELESINFDETQRNTARHLIGYQPRQYLNNIIGNEVSEFKFFQGMISEKGTVKSIEKIFNAYSDANSVVEVNEEWAVRTGEFGGINTVSELDIPLDGSKFVKNPQPIEVYSRLNANEPQITYQIPITSVYSSSDTKLFDSTLTSKRTLRSPGYVLAGTAKKVVDTLQDLAGTPASALKVGDLVWCGFESVSWNMYSLSKLSAVVTSIDYSNNLTVSFNNRISETIETQSDNLFVVPRGVGLMTVRVLRPRLNVGELHTGEYTGFEQGKTEFDTDATTFDSLYKYRVVVTDAAITTLGAISVSNLSDLISEVTFENTSKFPRTVNITVEKIKKSDNSVSVVDNAAIEVKFDRLQVLETDVIGLVDAAGLDLFFNVLRADSSGCTLDYVSNTWAPVEPAGVSIVGFLTVKERFERNKEQLVETIDATAISQAVLYNPDTNEIKHSIEVIDIPAGKLPSIAEKELRYIGYSDPAVYSVSNNSTLIVDAEQSWNDTQVGQLWWDLTRARYIESQLASTVSERCSQWNTLFPTASINICEWVSSVYSPEQWDALSGTTRGDSLGISGKTKYGAGSYCTETKIDSVTGQSTIRYFFWVVNPSIVPSSSTRTVPSSEISQLLADPVSYGLECLAVLGSNSFALVNLNRSILNENLRLRVKYKNSKAQSVPIHSQWKIISNSPLTDLPSHVEQKWIDSLVGVDKFGQLVPNPSLPDNLKYGIKNSPAQSMFIDRTSALKQVIDQVNEVISTLLVSDDIDLSEISAAEPHADETTFDSVVDFNSDLALIKTKKLSTAVLRPVIVNGTITDIIIDDPGFGYQALPEITVLGTGTGAELTVELNQQGQLASCNVRFGGSGYSSTTEIVVRPFTVLVKYDSDFYNKWSIKQWNSVKSSWDIVKVQSYNVSNFWQYADWFKDGITAKTHSDITLPTISSVWNCVIPQGSFLKIENYNSGGWSLFKKTSAESVTTFSFEDFELVGRQNGTIQFSSDLYQTTNISARFDELFFDQYLYDNYPVTEIQIILNFIKEKLFVNELKKHYISLFFNSINFALSEQLFTDWIFKTSFVSIKHTVGKLQQPAVLTPVLTESTEEYINEVKPYRTKVRKYISAYQTDDTTFAGVSDFDSPSVLDSSNMPKTVTAKIQGDTLVAADPLFSQHPWIEWKNNFGYKLSAISLVSGGSGYQTAPTVTVGDATAVAVIDNGTVVDVIVRDPGSTVISVPEVVFSGGNPTVPARAIAVVDTAVVRAISTGIKFDRIARSPILETNLVTEAEFAPNGAQTEFALKFSPDIKILHTVSGFVPRVLINGIEVVREQYTLSEVKLDGTYRGKISFKEAPAAGSTLEVTYKKNPARMSATDRINFFYNPTNQQLGKLFDYSQLMSGVDYGGTIVSGVGFSNSTGWGSQSWGSDQSVWDTTQDIISETITVVDSNIRQYTLSTVIPLGARVHVFVNGTRVDYDPQYENADPSKMETIVGDGVTSLVLIPNNVLLANGDSLAFVQDETEVDVTSIISAGDFTTALGEYSTATGLNPEDIVINGDSFVTSATSFAPEEVVPGQIVDSCSISVFGLNNDRTTAIYGFRMFKDMLNRVEYTRLNSEKTTVLHTALLQTDTQLVVDDGTMFDIPTPSTPGVIIINGERIEYRTLTVTGPGSVTTLSNLRRSTLGTSMPVIHNAGDRVVCVGQSEIIPYSDIETKKFSMQPQGSCTTRTVGQEVQLVITSEITGHLTVGSIIDIEDTTVSPAQIITATLTSWIENVGTSRVYRTDVILPEILDTVEFVGHPTQTAGTGSLLSALSEQEIADYGDDVLTVFDGGYRLKKHIYYKSDSDGLTVVNNNQPVEFTDFSVSLDGSQIQFTNPTNHKIVVIKKAGTMWTESGQKLEDATSTTAAFINAKSSFLPYV